MAGIYAIILEKSGIVYTNQTHGVACMQSKAEGVLVPFEWDYPLDEPNQSHERRLAQLLEDAMRLTESDADQIDAIFARWPPTACAKVDRTKLNDSGEAWVHIDIEETSESDLKGFGKCKAILTWPNSD
jgi:hypothetical protein